MKTSLSGFMNENNHYEIKDKLNILKSYIYILQNGNDKETWKIRLKYEKEVLDFTKSNGIHSVAHTKSTKRIVHDAMWVVGRMFGLAISVVSCIK